MLLFLSNATYVLIGWFKFLLLKFLYEYWPCALTNKLIQGDYIILHNYSFPLQQHTKCMPELHEQYKWEDICVITLMEISSICNALNCNIIELFQRAPWGSDMLLKRFCRQLGLTDFNPLESNYNTVIQEVQQPVNRW